MREKKKYAVGGACVLLTVVLVLLYGFVSNTFRIPISQNNQTVLSQSEQRFVKDKANVVLQLDEKLKYFPKEFLEGYLNSIVNPSGLTVSLENQPQKKADGKLMIVDDEARANVGKSQFTAPLFQIKGSFFIRKEESISQKKVLLGVCGKGELTAEEKKSLSYDGKPVRLIEADSSEEALELAEKENLDFMIGNQMDLVALLKEKNLMDQYKDVNIKLYERNICIMIEYPGEPLYSILNQLIHSADLRSLMGQAQESWYGISGSLVAEERYKDASVLLMIIFAAVFLTFFFYYLSNKNLYNELTDRMNQLVASKQEMQTTFNGVSYYMAELHPNGSIIDINEAFLRYVNRECLGRELWDVLQMPDEIAKKLESMLNRTQSTGERSFGEIALKRKILEVNIFPILDQRGNLEKLLFMGRDVTEMRMAERQMLQDNKMIAVGQLAAGVAHEIRNPLGVIRNYCYVLKNMKDEKIQEQAVQVIEKSVDSAGAIIDNLLDFSKASKKISGNVYIQSHIDSVIFLNKGMMKKKRIESVVLCEEDFQVQMAIESFDMILINLISNAVDAMNEDGKLTVVIERMEEKFCVEVTDTGTGIEDDILDDIFNPFFTTKGVKEGTGLGLYIVYNEVHKMNGKIQVRSKLGTGTTFKVTLPVKMEVESDEQGEF